MAWYNWSQTANSNGTADGSCVWPEGMAPSQVNDSARGMMAATAKWRDDIAGAIATAGTSTAYTVTTFSSFDTLAHMSGQMIAFAPHVTNAATVTLNVDGLGAKPLRSAPSVELVAGIILQGTPYVATYNNSTGEWILQNFFGNPYNIPLLGGIDYWGTTAPNSSFVMPVGQAISRTTYAAAFAILGTTYGVGDGSTTFNLPDKRGLVSAGVDNMGGAPSGGRMPGLNPGTIQGASTQTLLTTNLPAYTPTGSITVGTPQINDRTPGSGGLGALAINMGTGTAATVVGIGSGSGTILVGPAPAGTFTGNAQGGASTPFSNVQPTIGVNYILRVI